MEYINEKKTKQNRIIPFIAITVIFSLIVSISLLKYQIVDGANYELQAQQSNTTKVEVKAARGQIVDRYKRPLVTNQLSLSINIGTDFPNPRTSDDKETVKNKNQQGNNIILSLINYFSKEKVDYIDEFPISKTVPYSFIKGKEAEEDKLKSALKAQKYATAQNCIDILVDKYNIEGYDEATTRLIAGIRGQMLVSEYSNSNAYTFAKDIDSKFASQIIERQDEFLGIEVGEDSKRIYQNGDIAPHIIGTVGPIYSETYQNYKDKGYSMNAIVGQSGVESAFEDELRGISGKETIVRDKDGKVLDKYYLEGEEPRPGNTVQLSIDSQFQKALQDALASYVKSTGGKGAGLSVIDVKTGETLALVTCPGYDMNEYKLNYDKLLANPLTPLNNRAINGTYRPGSSFKTFMSAAGMLNGTFTKTTYYNCVNPFPGTDMKCLQDHHSGMTNVYTALQRSCNNFFYNVAKNMGIDKIDEYAEKFGFATDTGLEIKHSKGRVTNPKYYEELKQPYLPGYTYQTGIGQAEVLVTPLQMSISMMTIANHGTRYAAHLIKSIDKYDGIENIKTTDKEILSSLPSDSDAYDVTIEGMKLMASTRAALAGLDIAAKSGSPQYDDNNKNKTHAAGVGIYPASNPEIGMGIIIEDGKRAQDFFATVVRLYNEYKNQGEQLIN